MNSEFETLSQIVQKRKTVRIFTPDPVPRDVIEASLDIALLAPNSSNLQPWDFFWVRDEKAKKEMAKICLNQSAARTASDFIAVVARPDLWKRGQKINIDFITSHPEVDKKHLEYYTKIVPMAYHTGFFDLAAIAKSLFLNFKGLFSPTYRGPLGKKGNLLWATKTSALAAENLMLAFTAAGYATCPMEGFDQKRAKKLLSLPRGANITMILAVGKEAEGGVFGPRIRGDREIFIKRI